MVMDGTSADRKKSMRNWDEAKDLMERGRTEQAIELVNETLRADPKFADLRLWIAKHFAEMGEDRKATAHLERVLQADHDHEEAWELLQETNPETAERLRRLHDVGPDPFARKEDAPVTDDVGDLSEFAEEEEQADEYSGASEPSGADDELMGSMDELDESEAEAEPAEGGTDESEEPWEYEQDREYLGRWRKQPLVREAVDTIRELWEALDEWERVYGMCAHGSRRLHEEIYSATETTAETLGREMPDLYVFPERCMHPVLIKHNDPAIAVPRAITRAMTSEEMIFQIGREVGHLNTGYLPEMQMVKVICDRQTQLAGDLASEIQEFIADKVGYRAWDYDDEKVERLKQLGHAWQQRCELTADRAGLICCQDVDVACRTLAKTTADSRSAAADMTESAFMNQFEGEDVGQLAAIPVEASPSRAPQYVAYRMHMLRWWAGTDEAAEFVFS